MTNPISARLTERTESVINSGEMPDALLQEAANHIDAQDAKIKALVEALEGMRELVRDEEFCLCEYKDNTTPADQGPEIDAADAALAAAEEPT